MNDNYALVTGASGGIGKEIANELAKQKQYNLILVARSSDILEEVASEISNEYQVTVHHIALDLSKEHSVQTLMDKVAQLKITPDLLVNNAGVGIWGRFADLPLTDQLSMMHLNMSSLVGLTYEFINIHKKNNSYARILNVASTTAYQPVPTMSVYAASKSFVMSFSQGLAYELRKTNIKVTYLSPGATTTGFMDKAGMDDMKEMAEKFSMEASEVAQIAVKKLFKNKKEIITGMMNYISSKISVHLPAWLTCKIAANIYEKHLPKIE